MFRLYTNGQNNTLIMGLKECKAEDEGDFACIVTTAKGSATFDFKLFVTVEGGMDFRSVMMMMMMMMMMMILPVERCCRRRR